MGCQTVGGIVVSSMSNRLFIHPKPLKWCVAALLLVSSVWAFAAEPVGTTSNAGSSANSTDKSAEPPVGSMEKWLVGAIAETKGKLQDPTLSETIREILKSDLSRYETKLTALRKKLQEDQKTREALHAKSERLRRLATPPQDLQQLFRTQQTEYEKIQADTRLNVQLWANYSEAKRKKEPELVAKAERELADYLTAKIERIDGKKYPTGMTLAEAMKYW